MTDLCTAQPISGTSRAGLLTGYCPNRIGFSHAPEPGCPYGMSDDEQTLVEVLKTGLHEAVRFLFAESPFNEMKNRVTDDCNAVCCAQDKTRTCTPEPALPPKSSVSPNFTTWASLFIYN